MGNFCCRELPGDKPLKNTHGEIASFGMQCFWDPDAHFGVTPGVIRSRVGYSGGTKRSPNYENIGDHTETVEVEYDRNKVSYQDLLELFWKHSILTTQYVAQYRSVIFYHTQEQKNLAEQSFKENQLKRLAPILTTIEAASKFYPAEQYHQKFRLKRHEKLLKLLKCSDSQLVRSHVAARLNGYVCRFGTIQMFEKELGELSLTPEVEGYVREMLSPS